ncbi:MAG: CARDB domain-containing protein, partial [Thermoplasmata archaeon]
DYRYAIAVNDNTQIYANNSKVEKGRLSGNASVLTLNRTNYTGGITGFHANTITFVDTNIVSEVLEFHGSVYAENTTFDRKLVFNGTDNITLVGVTLPTALDAVLASDNAIVKIYRYLEVHVTDVNGFGVDNANVNVYNITMNPVASTTTVNGSARITLITDIIDATTPYSSNFVGVYIVELRFGQIDQWYNITLPAYPLWTPGTEIAISLSSAVPDLSVRFVSQIPQLILSGSQINITIEVVNTGNARVENLLVEVYDGLSTVYSNTTTILAGESRLINFTYYANPTGDHTMIAVVDPAGQFVETTKENNNATVEFIVYSAGTPWIIENETVTITSTYYHYGSILIGYNGTLIIDGATLKISQPTDYTYGIFLYSNGTLVLNHARIESNFAYYLALLDNATISAMSGTIDTAKMLGKNETTFTFINTTISNSYVDLKCKRFTMVGGTLTEGAWLGVSIIARSFYAQDIYYPSKIILKGNATAILINVTLTGGQDDIITEDAAEARIYRYLVVNALDGNSMPIDGVSLVVRFATNGTIAGENTTDIYGNARFVLLTDIINYTIQSIGGSSIFIGNYRLESNYSGENQIMNISFESYPSAINLVKVNLSYHALLPDFAVYTGDIHVPSTFDYLSGGNVNITVRNIGPRNGINVTVVVYDINVDANTETEIYTTTLILFSGQVVSFNFTWSPSLPGNHSIKVVIDPLNLYNETSKANNIAISSVVKFNPSLEIIGIAISNNTLPYDENVTINITVKNTGNVNMKNFLVILEDTYLHQSFQEFIGALYMNQSVNISFSYPVTSPGIHAVNLRIELDRVYDAETINLNVYSPPDLSVNADAIRILYKETPVYNTVVEGTPLSINITITNLGDTDARNVTVEVYNDTYLIGSIIIPTIKALSSTEISISWNASLTGAITVSIRQCTEPYLEKHLDNNIAEKRIEVIPLPDIRIIDLFLVKNGNRTLNITAGDTVEFWLNITSNVNYRIENLSIEIFAGNITEEKLMISSNITLEPVANISVNYTWVADMEGNLTFFAVVNRNHTIIEKNYTNNIYALNITSLSAKLRILMGALPPTFKIGDVPVISGQIVREATGVGAPNVNVTILMFHGDQVAFSQTIITDENGNFTLTLAEIKDAGEYRIVVSCPGFPELNPSVHTFNVEKPVPPPQFPWLIVIIAIVAVVGVSIGVVIIYFRRTAGKLVECGECGAYIPENAPKCPKCGTIFEETTVKCSECGAWIDGGATVCPECGTVFTGRKVEAESYEEIMRREFNAYVEKFKTEARKELGKEYSESAFWAWWKNKPTYRTYTQWLKEEELKKKGALKCPQCTTLNEKTAKVCHKCGSSLEGAELIQTGKSPQVPVEKKEEKPKAPPTPPPLPPAQAPPKAVAEPQKVVVPPQKIETPKPPAVPLPPKPVKPKEEMPTLPLGGVTPKPEGVPGISEKAVLEFKPEEGAPSTQPKVVVIRKPTAAKVVVPKKVIRKPIVPGETQQEDQGQPPKEDTQKPM